MKKFLFWVMLFLPLFEPAAVTRVTVIGGDSAGIRSAIAADPEFILADWADVPAFGRLDAEFVQARKSMPDTDFLIVVDPAYNTAIFNVNRACLVAEFLSDSAAATVKHLRKAVTADELFRSASLYLGPTERTGRSSEAEDFFGREIDRLFADRDSILLIWQPDPARSVSCRTFFRFHFPMNPDSEFFPFHATANDLHLGGRKGQLLSVYYGKRPKDAALKKVCEILQKYAEDQLAVFTALPDDPLEKAKRLADAYLYGSALEVLTRAAVESPRNALVQKTLFDMFYKLTPLAGYRKQEQIYSIPRAALESIRKLRVAGCRPSLPERSIINLETMNWTFAGKEQPEYARSTAWEALRQFGAELREEVRLIRRNSPLAPYNPDGDPPSAEGIKLFFAELREIDFNRFYFVNADDYRASLKEGVRKELEVLDRYYTSGEQPGAGKKETRTPGFLPSVAPSTPPNKREFEVRATYENIEFAAQGKSRELRQLAQFWEMTKYCQENTLTREEYLSYYRNYCMEVKKIYGEEKPRYSPEDHPLPIADEARKELLKQRTAVVRDVFQKEPPKTQTVSNRPAAPRPVASKPAIRFPAPETVQPERWFAVQTTAVASEKTEAFPSWREELPLARLTELVPAVHSHMLNSFASEQGIRMMNAFESAVSYNWRQNPAGILSGEQRGFLNKFNSKVLVREAFKTPARWLIINSVMRQGAIYFMALEGREGKRIALYRFDLQKQQGVRLGEAAVRPKVFLGYNEMFDVEGKYAVWMQKEEGHYFEGPDASGWRGGKVEHPEERLYVFDMEERKTWNLTDFPREGLQSVTLLDGKIYLMLQGGMLLAMNPDGGERKVVFDKQRKESRNWFEETGVGWVVRANPYRKTLLALGDGFCEFDPLTLTGTVLADPAEAYGISLADDTLFFMDKLYGYYSYSLKTGRYQRRVLLAPERFTSDSKRRAAFPHVLEVKVGELIWNHPFLCRSPQNPFSFCFQKDLMMVGRSIRIVNVKEPEKSVPLLLTRHDSEHWGRDSYPASDGTSFWVVLPEGTILLITPKGK